MTSSTTQVRDLQELIQDQSPILKNWNVRVIIQDDNLTYLVWNDLSKEALVVDPVKDDWAVLLKETGSLKGFRFLAVIDTHTHADHISCAADLAAALSAPLIQHALSPSRKIHLRVSRDTSLSTVAGPLRLLVTPGHTPDGVTPIWGPFVFTGDTILHGDTGRDDLPGGDPEAHWESLQKINQALSSGGQLGGADYLICPGHDSEKGRVTSWKTQLTLNPSLTQAREIFVQEAGAYRGAAPRLLKESLFENFK